MMEQLHQVIREIEQNSGSKRLLVVGAAEVHSWGGQVEIVPTVERYSASGLIARGAGAKRRAGKRRQEPRQRPKAPPDTIQR